MSGGLWWERLIACSGEVAAGQLLSLYLELGAGVGRLLFGQLAFQRLDIALELVLSGVLRFADGTGRGGEVVRSLRAQFEALQLHLHGCLCGGNKTR